uniref:PH01B019A14.6 protein n=1 Tax=Phyllostachys edulis TaxID=38705 RepID=L0P2F6_PHYED|nr:PH01B019A14.6 [Phyllostachys edulis]
MEPSPAAHRRKCGWRGPRRSGGTSVGVDAAVEEACPLDGEGERLGDVELEGNWGEVGRLGRPGFGRGRRRELREEERRAEDHGAGTATPEAREMPNPAVPGQIRPSQARSDAMFGRHEASARRGRRRIGGRAGGGSGGGRRGDEGEQEEEAAVEGGGGGAVAGGARENGR